MKTFRAILTPDDVAAALGDWVARKHNLDPQPAKSQVMFIYDVTDLKDIKIQQARVEVEIAE